MAPAPKAPTLKERVVVGADEVTFEGEGLAALEKVMFGTVPLTMFTVASDGKSVKISGLVGKGVTKIAMTHSLAFHLKEIETPLKADLVVVSSKIETVSKSQASTFARPVDFLSGSAAWRAT